MHLSKAVGEALLPAAAPKIGADLQQTPLVLYWQPASLAAGCEALADGDALERSRWLIWDGGHASQQGHSNNCSIDWRCGRGGRQSISS